MSLEGGLTPGASPGNSRLRVALTFLAVLAILIATLRPQGGELPHGWSFALLAGPNGFAEILQNIMLFVPLGIALALGKTTALRAVAAGFLLSLTVEVIQQWLPGRDPSVGDLVFNTLGTGVGVLLVRTAPRWLAIADRRAAWLSLLSAVLAATTWLGTGWLLEPMLPSANAYEVRTRPPGQHMDQYTGRVLSVTGRIGVTEPLRIVATAGTPSARLAPILDVVDAVRIASTLVAADRHDLLLRNRSRSMLHGLDRPVLRARDAFIAGAPGDTITITAWTDGKGPAFCLGLNEKQWCGLGYTMGDGWKLIFFPEHFSATILSLLNALWIGGWCLGIGWWGRRHAATWVALGLVTLTLLVGPGMVGLLPTPLGEMAGGAGGMLLGTLTFRRYRVRKTTY